MLVSESKIVFRWPSRVGKATILHMLCMNAFISSQMTQKSCAVGMRNAILANNLRDGKLIIKGYHNTLLRVNTYKL